MCLSTHLPALSHAAPHLNPWAQDFVCVESCGLLFSLSDQFLSAPRSQLGCHFFQKGLPGALTLSSCHGTQFLPLCDTILPIQGLLHSPLSTLSCKQNEQILGLVFSESLGNSNIFNKCLLNEGIKGMHALGQSSDLADCTKVPIPIFAHLYNRQNCKMVLMGR